MILLRGIPSALVPAYPLLMLGAGSFTIATGSNSVVGVIAAFVVGLFVSFGLLFGPSFCLFRVLRPNGNFSSDFPKILLDKKASPRGIFFAALAVTYFAVIAAIVQMMMRFPGALSSEFWVYQAGATGVALVLLLISYLFEK